MAQRPGRVASHPLSNLLTPCSLPEHFWHGLALQLSMSWDAPPHVPRDRKVTANLQKSCEVVLLEDYF